MKRQLDDYFSKFYNKMAERSHVLQANDYAKAKEIAAWKEVVAQRWDAIEVVSSNKTESIQQGLFETGKAYDTEYVIDEKGLDDAVGVEMVVMGHDADGNEKLLKVVPLELVKREGNLYTFHGHVKNEFPGSFKVAYRMYPKNADLPHRQDFCYVKWFY